MITRAQIRAARALIGITQEELAFASGVSSMSVKNVERGAANPRVSTLRALQQALEASGVEFICAADGRGVGVRLTRA